jgi:hypothetical protein
MEKGKEASSELSGQMLEPSLSLSLSLTFSLQKQAEGSEYFASLVGKGWERRQAVRDKSM